MGSYTAPGFALGYEKGVADNTTALNTVIVGPITCVDFIQVHKHTALWDGQIILQLQKTDNTWLDFNTMGAFTQNPMSEHIDVNYATLNNQDIKYPFVVRKIVGSAATLGATTEYLITSPGPANPLF